MKNLTKARALALATLLAFCMGVALPSADALARGNSDKSAAAENESAKKSKHYKSRSAKRTGWAKRKSSSRNASRQARGHRHAHSHRHAKSHRRHAHRKHAQARQVQRRTRSASHRRHRTADGGRRAGYRHHRMSLGATTATQSRSMHRHRESSGNISWSASSGCLNSGLRSIMHQVAAAFGSLRVNSTCRSRSHNSAVGGATHSHHLTGDAVDFRVFGNIGGVASFLRSHSGVGGFKHYGGGLFHIDTGPRRSW